jgi:23S rRNA (pseudouridine1915-N3)-methyltransferase
MKLRVIWTGKTRNPPLSALSDDYVARIRRFLPLDVSEVKETRTSDDRKRIAGESERILGRIEATDYVVGLDDCGQERTSEELAQLIECQMGEGQRDLVFVVGGPAGLSDALKRRCDLRLSLSRLTFSHDLARAVVLEQIYRALTIIRNLPYAR